MENEVLSPTLRMWKEEQSDALEKHRTDELATFPEKAANALRKERLGGLYDRKRDGRDERVCPWLTNIARSPSNVGRDNESTARMRSK